MSIFITSDWHFCHNKEFLYAPRGFTSVYDMNNTIIDKYNSVVSTDDDVYVLGDLMLNDTDLASKCIKQLKGKIHIIRGNHDTDNKIELYKTFFNVVEIVDAKYLDYNGYHFFLCHYPTITSSADIVKPIKKKLINICGHTHTKDKFLDFNKGAIYHAEVDAHDCYPVNLDQIIQDLNSVSNI